VDEDDSLADFVSVGGTHSIVVSFSTGSALAPPASAEGVPVSAAPVLPPPVPVNKAVVSRYEGSMVIHCGVCGVPTPLEFSVDPQKTTLGNLKALIGSALEIPFTPDGAPMPAAPTVSGPPKGERTYQIFIKSLDGKTITLDVWGSMSMASLIDHASPKLGLRHKDAHPSLVWGGKVVTNDLDRTMGDIGIEKESTLHVLGRATTSPESTLRKQALRLTVDLFAADHALHSTVDTDKRSLSDLAFDALAPPGLPIQLFAVVRAADSSDASGAFLSSLSGISGGQIFQTTGPCWFPVVPRPGAAVHSMVQPVDKQYLAELGSTLRVLSSSDAVTDKAFAGMLARLRQASGFPPACLALARLRDQSAISDAERCTIVTALHTAGKAFGVDTPLHQPRVIFSHLLGGPSVVGLGQSGVSVTGRLDSSLQDDSVSLSDIPPRSSFDPCAFVLVEPSASDDDDAYPEFSFMCRANPSARLVDPVLVDVEAMEEEDARNFFRGKAFSLSEATSRIPGGAIHNPASHWAKVALAMLKPHRFASHMLELHPASVNGIQVWRPQLLSEDQCTVLSSPMEGSAFVAAATSAAGASAPADELLSSADTREHFARRQLGLALASAVVDRWTEEMDVRSFFTAKRVAEAAARAVLPGSVELVEQAQAALYKSPVSSIKRLRVCPLESVSHAPKPSLTFGPNGHVNVFVDHEPCSTNVMIYDPLTGKATGFNHAELAPKVKSMPAVVEEMARAKAAGLSSDRPVSELCAVLLDMSGSMAKSGFPEEVDPFEESDKAKLKAWTEFLVTNGLGTLFAEARKFDSIPPEPEGPQSAVLRAAVALFGTEEERSTLKGDPRTPERVEQDREFDESVKGQLLTCQSLCLLRMVFRDIVERHRDSGSTSSRMIVSRFVQNVLPYSLMDQESRMIRRDKSMLRIAASLARQLSLVLVVLLSDPEHIDDDDDDEPHEGEAASSSTSRSAAPASSALSSHLEEAMSTKGSDAELVRAFCRSEKFRGQGAPEACLCPLTNKLLVSPVKWADGHVYERAAIMAHVKASMFGGVNVTSPVDPERIFTRGDGALQFTPDAEALAAVDEFLRDHPLGFVEDAAPATDGLEAKPIKELAIVDGEMQKPSDVLPPLDGCLRVRVSAVDRGSTRELDGKDFAMYINDTSTPASVKTRLQAAFPELRITASSSFMSPGSTFSSLMDLTQQLLSTGKAEDDCLLRLFPSLGSYKREKSVMPVRLYDDTSHTCHQEEFLSLWLCEGMTWLDLKILLWHRYPSASKEPHSRSLWYNFRRSGDGFRAGSLLEEDARVSYSRWQLYPYKQPLGTFCDMSEIDRVGDAAAWGPGTAHPYPSGVIIMAGSHFTPYDSPDIVSRELTVKELFNSFVNRCVAYDEPIELSLTIFNNSVEETCEFTPLFEEFRSKVKEAEPDGDTSLIDAIGATVSRLKARKDTEHPEARLRILVLSDGRDTSSEMHVPHEVAQKLQSNSITLDAVVIGDEVSRDLFALAKCTGGFFFNPKTLDESQRLVELELFLSTLQRAERPPPRLVTDRRVFRAFMDTTKYPPESCEEGRLPAMRVNPRLAQPASDLNESVNLTTAAAAVAEETLARAKKEGETGKAEEAPPSSDPIKRVAAAASGGTRPLQRLQRLNRELISIRDSPHAFVEVFPSSDDPGFWKLLLRGADGSPYAGGIWLATMEIPESFPRQPPMVRFQTPIRHVNVSPYGRVCHPILGSAWSASQSLRGVMDVLYSLFLTPEIDSPVDSVLAMQYSKEGGAYEVSVKEHTERFASSKTIEEWREELKAGAASSA
jgi:ubiquitin-protein ligase